MERDCPSAEARQKKALWISILLPGSGLLFLGERRLGWWLMLPFLAFAGFAIGRWPTIINGLFGGRLDERVAAIFFLVVMVGLLIDGKMTRFLVPRHGDWAANNIFFFGALALAVISAYALKTSAPKDQEA